MATIHDFPGAKKDSYTKMDSKKFREWYKIYLKLGNDKNYKGIDEAELEAALDRECEAVEELLPEAGIDSLHEGDDCKLCADDGDVKRATAYATADLGHPRETEDESDLFGTRYGHAIPVHISCCKRCRRNYFLVTYLPTIIGIIISLAAFIVISERSVREPLMAVFTVMPVLVFLAAVGLSMLICALIRRFLLDKLGQKTKFDIFEIDRLHYMKVGGWVNLYDESNYSKLMFSKELPGYLPKKDVEENAEETEHDTEDFLIFDYPEEEIEETEDAEEFGDLADTEEDPE